MTQTENNFRQIIRRCYDGVLKALRVTVIGPLTGNFAPSGLLNGGRDTVISVPSTQWVKVERSATSDPVIGSGDARLTETNSMKLVNQGTVNIKTTLNDDPNGNSQTYAVGDEIFLNNSQFMDLREKDQSNVAIDIWVRAESGTGTLFFREIS